MSSWLWDVIEKVLEVIQRPENREALSWLGGGIAVVGTGAWAVFKFFAERKKADEKKGGDTNVAVEQGAASGRDTTFQGPVSFAPSPELVAQIQKPLADELAAQRAQIENMTKMLLEQNPSAAGPGARQAVGEAVQSIAHGAAEGDSRLQQALEFLKGNKIAEATQLLSAFAEDKTARIGKDRKEAAIAYRNLGAIAGLADPKRALEAYEKAAELDPDDLDSLFWAGWIQIDYGDLNQAQTRLERVLTLAKTDDQAFYKYWALVGLGDIKQRRGDLAGALKSYNDGLAISERLAKAAPGNAGWQRHLSVSYNKIGDVQMAQGDLAGALKSYKNSLAIRDRLAKSDPGNALWQRDLSVSNERLGDIFLAQGNRPAALEQYRASLERMVPIRDRDPSNADLQRFTSVTLNKVGDVQKAQGDLAGALKSYNDGLAISERLAKAAPGNAGWQRDLSVSNERLGDIFLAQGNLPVALEQYRASLQRMVPIRDRDQSNADLQRFTSVTFSKLALVHKQSGDSAKALDALRQGRAIMARLTKLSPDNATWKQDLARFDRDIAKLAAR